MDIGGEEIFIISGPTASGKTAKAIELAKAVDAEIISCDSVQVYEFMDIGSAKPSAKERAEIPHHLIDVCHPSRQFSVGEYVALSKHALEKILKNKKRVIVAGGSGFYLKAWFSPVTDEIEIPKSVKDECQKLFDLGGSEALKEKLLSLDPEAADSIDIQNPRRIRPALERVLATSLTLKELRRKFESLPCPMGNFKINFKSTDMPDEELFKRVKTRAEKMIEDGLIEETKKLMSIGIEKNPSAAMAIGYRETMEAIRQNDFSNLAEKIFLSTKKLIKKQRKFLKTQIRL
ncbi:tRNA (adenosine(37)-N6)-dimethylallyltransferase MiaA [Intestinicryptomonas porci]|uniref:tRNA dimethylallyltransferase n=1 Tax=Intestinicryptomonas porci TaxID=2926320 RepID=A0ABU4WHT4_9BACT|nr:tRNA (adenosine(37)-N6)-dimethylallyltransferase MiaA [Opitutales bacterium CLA-KB-P66]